MSSKSKIVAPSRPGIRKLYFIPVNALPRHMMISAICNNLPHSLYGLATEIPFAGSPTFYREGTVLYGARAEKTTLEFRTDMKLTERYRLAFVVEQANGECSLIGTAEPNYPVMEYTDNAGSPGGDPSVRTYKITHADIRSGIPVRL